MITAQPKFISIIFIGRQNPQILNHDFLLQNNILPTDKSPFREAVLGENKEKPFSDFISTPVLSKLTYKNINIVIEESRYQILDSASVNPTESPIVEFTKRYFSLLKYTPIALGGFNFNYLIQFGSKEERIAFENKFISDRNGVYKEIGIVNFEIGLKIECPFNDNKIEITFGKLPGNDLLKAINFNYEFRYRDMNSFLANLDDSPILFGKLKDILTKLKVQC